MKNRSASLKTVAVTAFLVGLLVFGTTYYVLSPATINVYLDDLPSQATYTIKTDATFTNIWAVRYDGYKQWESTSATTLFNYVSSAIVSLGGGSVHITAGTYLFTDHVNVDVDNVLWFGQGQATHLKLASGRPNAAGDWSKWCIFLAETASENVTIRDLWFDGNYAGNNNLGSITHGLAAVYIYGAINWLVDHCWITDHRVNGIDFIAYDGESYGNIVQNCYIANTRWNGISFGGGDHDIHDCKAVNNLLWGLIGDIALCVSGDWSGTHDAYRIVFDGNTVLEMIGTEGSSGDFWCGIKFEFYSNSCVAIHNKIYNVRYGIYEAGNGFGNHTACDNEIRLKDADSLPEGINIPHAYNLIENNVIYAPPTNDSRGISLPSDLSANNYNRVIGNRLINTGSGWMVGVRALSGNTNYFAFNDVLYCDDPFSVAGSSNLKFEGNIGFITENAGSQASCINGTAITHGLAGTPTSVVLTMYGQNYINSTCWYLPPTLLSMTSATFTVCFTIFNVGTIKAVAAPNSRTIYWEALYKP